MIVEIVQHCVWVVAPGTDSEHDLFVGEPLLSNTLNPLLLLPLHLEQRLLASGLQLLGFYLLQLLSKLSLLLLPLELFNLSSLNLVQHLVRLYHLKDVCVQVLLLLLL